MISLILLTHLVAAQIQQTPEFALDGFIRARTSAIARNYIFHPSSEVSKESTITDIKHHPFKLLNLVITGATAEGILRFEKDPNEGGTSPDFVVHFAKDGDRWLMDSGIKPSGNYSIERMYDRAVFFYQNAGTWATFMDKSLTRDSEEEELRRNFRMFTNVMEIRLDDYDYFYPAKGLFARAIKPYIRRELPSNLVFNEELAGINRKTISTPEDTILYFMGQDGKPIFKNNRCIVVFVDGQIRFLSPEDFTSVQLKPALKSK